MWTSSSRNHTSEHHSPLSSKPDVVVSSALSLRRPHAEDPPAAALDVDRKPPQSPFLDRATRADCARPARQRFALDAALIGPHAPGARFVLRNEVDVRALGRDPRSEPQRPAALLQRHVVYIVD